MRKKNERLNKDNCFLFDSYQKEKRMHDEYDRATQAISLFRKQEPEAFVLMIIHIDSNANIP